MQYRNLGSSDLNISEITLGSWLTYGVSETTDTAKACVDKAFDLGINFIDTANIYGVGAAETVLGEVLKDRPRDSYYIATKLFWPMDEENYGLSAQQVQKQCEDSLRRLQIETIDLYQAHRHDDETPVAETMEAFTKLIEQGKVRYIGFSEWTAPQIEEALAVPGVAKFVSSQPQYSMLHRVPEAQVIPLCKQENIGQITWSPLAHGILSGKYKPGEAPPQDSRAAKGSQVDSWIKRLFEKDGLLEAVQELRPIADEAGLSMAQLAIAWILQEQNVSSVIIGASKPEQIEDNVGAVGVKLDDDVLKKIDDVLEPFIIR